jgi:spoIIIJ-associated protein
MTKRVFTGKTVDDAVRKGLAELGVTEKDVSVTVLAHHSKGFLGFIGAKEAKVELELHPIVSVTKDEWDPITETRAYLADIIREMGITAEIEQSVDEEGHIVFNVSGKDLGVFIGRRGQTLDAVQVLVNVFVNRISGDHIRIVLDAEQFRVRRKKTLEDLSLRLANQVIRSKKEVVLEPMSSHERRIIHSQLQNHPKVKTFSKGDEPNRRIVITLK